MLRGGSILAGLLATCVAVPAAADGGTVEHRVHMQLQLSLVDHRKLSGSIESDRTSDDSRLETRQTQYGLASRLALGLGYGLTESLELMLRAALSVRKESSTLDTGDGELQSPTDKVRTVELLPSLRYVGKEGDQRFFFGAGLGYEGSKRSSGRLQNGSMKAFVMSAQTGFYCFLREGISIDPTFELAFVRGSVRLPGAEPQDELSGSARGVRVLLTLGLSAWLHGSDEGAVAPIDADPERAQAHMEPNIEHATRFAAVQLEGLSLELAGDPARSATELQLLLTRHETDEPPCRVVLLSDHPPEPLEPVWYLNGADEVGPILTGAAPVSVSQLEHWLANDPSLSVCGRGQLIRPALRAELEAAVARFRQAATAASTRPSEAPEEAAGDPLKTAPEQESARPSPDP